MKAPRLIQTGRYSGFLFVFFFVQCFLHAQSFTISPDDTPAKLGFTVSAALSLPMEDFGKTNTIPAGYAIPGPALVFEYDKRHTDNWYWSTSLTLGINGMDKEELQIQAKLLPGGDLKVDAGSYTSIWLLTGAKYLFPGSNLYATLQFGVLQSVFPDITVYNSTVSVKQTTKANPDFAISMALGYSLGKYTFGLKYNSGTPKYEQTATNGSTVTKVKVDLPMDILMVYAGMSF